jgi:drug/metabolite transporter (DMT)-like permease
MHEPRFMTSEMIRIPVAMRAALWMGGALMSFALMAISVRELHRSIGSFEIVFLRSVISLLIMLALLPQFGGRALITRRFGLHVVRNVLHFAGQSAWVFAIGALPLATVFAIEFTMPVWTAVLASFILGEQLNRGRVVMLAMGLAGIFIILKPGFQHVPPAALVMLCGSLAYASTMIATKRLAAHDTVFAVLFYMAAIQVPLGFLFALPEWITPGVAELPWIIAVGATGLSAHMCLTRAFRIADATLVVPFDFLRLPLIAVVGMLFYSEPPQLAVFLGAGVIFAGTYYSISRESRRATAVSRGS